MRLKLRPSPRLKPASTSRSPPSICSTQACSSN
ncbi:MAG: hypothetical protein AVDCRST_MAG86-2089, partial [uncultured Truepera sp.]